MLKLCWFFKNKHTTSTLLNHIHILYKHSNKYLHLSSQKPLILGIESSCDDTCAAVLDADGNILSNVKQSQLEDHNSFGGVLPSISYKLHAESIGNVVLKALKNAHVKRMNELIAVAVTNQPGLTMSLTVGLDYAQRLCSKYQLPMVPIHHMEAHALTGMLAFKQLHPPFLCLLISGGHAQIALFKTIDQIFLLGDSSDIAPGDLFDKLVRDMKLKNLGPPYDCLPGGEIIERLNSIGTNDFKFGRLPIDRYLTCDLSFTGMSSVAKSYVEKWLLEHPTKDAPFEKAPGLCSSVLKQLCAHIANRLQRAVKMIECTNILDDNVTKPNQISFKTIDYCEEPNYRIPLVISGGVACSNFITEFIRTYVKNMQTFYDSTQVPVFVPRPHMLCTDNAVMIAWNGLLKVKQDCHVSKDQSLIIKNNPKYCLMTDEQRNQVQVCNKAPLGINIGKIVHDLQLPVTMLSDQHIEQIMYELKCEARQRYQNETNC